MNHLNFITGNSTQVTTNSKQVPTTILSDILLTYAKIKELMESRFKDFHPGTTDSMYLEEKQIRALFLAGQLQYVNEEYEAQSLNLPNSNRSSMNEATQKRARVVTPEQADPETDIDFDRPETLKNLFP